MSLENWRDLSVVWLLIPPIILSLIPAAILFFMLRGMNWVLRQVRKHAPVVQGYFRRGAQISERVSQKVASPFIAADARAAQVQHVGMALRRSVSRFNPWHPKREV